jgi:hypothetical protein
MEDIKKTVGQLTKIHLAICLALAGVIIVFFYVLAPTIEPNDSLGMTFEFVVPLVAILSIGAGIFVSRQRLKSITNEMSLVDKLNTYKLASIVKWATVEGAALFASIAYILTFHNNLILYATMLGVYLIYTRPIKSKIIEDLKLSDEEAETLMRS